MNENVTGIDASLQGILERMDILLAKLAGRDAVQEVIRPEDIEDYLSKNWRYVDSFNNGRETFVIVEIDHQLPLY